MRLVRCLVLVSVIAGWSLATAEAQKPPEPRKALQSIGREDFKLAELTEKSITLRKTELEVGKTSTRRVQTVDNDYTYDLAPDVMFRRQELPRGADGRALQLSNEDYARLREPAGAPGFKADRSIFRSGQIVRVWFARESPRDRPIVTTVMLLRDSPEPPRKADDKKKEDKKSTDKKPNDKKSDGKSNDKPNKKSDNR
jgi:hypothetical protein